MILRGTPYIICLAKMYDKFNNFNDQIIIQYNILQFSRHIAHKSSLIKIIGNLFFYLFLSLAYIIQ